MIPEGFVEVFEGLTQEGDYVVSYRIGQEGYVNGIDRVWIEGSAISCYRRPIKSSSPTSPNTRFGAIAAWVKHSWRRLRKARNVVQKF